MKEAAQQGHTGAQHKLGLCYERGEGVPRDSELAILWYIKASEAKITDAVN